ncbi:MAG: NAD(P)-binding protein [Pseudomonadales bacterium]|nr:NAD(P)-binding protein [Pseudomonadales bacterium]
MGITRRDLVSGFGIALGALHLSPLEAIAAGLLDPRAAGPEYYPPALTGLRGNHAGSFEAAHALALQGQQLPYPATASDSRYDLVVVGGGISGLAAARFFREQHGGEVRILVLDNHDDFGGHAKRNEFTIDGHGLIGYGGSQSIDTPSSYSPQSAGLLRDLGIDTSRFYRYYDSEFLARNKLGAKLFFDQAHYGVDRLVDDPLGASWLGAGNSVDPAAVERMPLDAESRAAYLRLITGTQDLLAGKSTEQKISLLRGMSYDDFLRRVANMPEPVVLMLRNQSMALWGVGYDALSALEAARNEMPGTLHLGIGAVLSAHDGAEDEPYIFHFPDGNAGIARLLVRDLVPTSASGRSMEDIVLTPLHYEQLDLAQNAVRIRLNATVLDVRHGADAATVDVMYVRAGRTERVQASHAVLACYNNIIPYICSELPAAQVEALRWPQKVPLVYTNVALRNWRAFAKAGMAYFFAPQDFFGYGMLDFPVSMPGYAFSENPDQPILLHLAHTPTVPGLPPREQFRQGRATLLGLRFEDFEQHVVRQLQGMLGEYGFDASRDIAAITVNRWPHGYAYEYIDLYDPVDWGPDKGPHISGRTRCGRISIANSDSQALAYVNGAIDAAWRAVSEQLEQVG